MNGLARWTPIALLLLLAAPSAAQSQLEADTACFAARAELLADDAMEGRGVGTEGLLRAATQIAAWMAEAGLEPADEGDYLQGFEVTTGVTLGDDNRLSVGDEALAIEADFVPLGFSQAAEFSGSLVFAGYGISAPDLGYDDYAGLDVAGRVVLALRFEPGEADEDSPFDGRRSTRWSDLRYKAHLAREAGAAALIFVTGPHPDPEAPDELPGLRTHGPGSHAGLPVLQITRDAAQRWLATWGHDLGGLQQAIDTSYSPHSLVLEDVLVSGRADVEPVRAAVANVLGVAAGSGTLADEVVVVGAHYDHLGLGEHGSRAVDRMGEIHNGADDNASGTAAVLCALEGLVAAAPEAADRRTLLVALFSAEELGLGGSGHYVDHPVFDLTKTVAMVNLDMVGRVRDGELSGIGTDSSPLWAEILTEAARPVGLTLSLGGDGYGPSDQTVFYEHDIPVVHLFSGAHEEYHTPDDDFATLNLDGGGRVTGLLRGTLEALLTRAERPAFVASSGGPVMGGDSRGYGAYLGSIPDYSAMLGDSGGVLLSGVRAGGPAELAGLRGGDTIVAFGDRAIENLYDLTFALRDNLPGEVVTLEVLREGEHLAFEVTLRRRGADDSSGGHGHGSAEAWAPAAGEAADALLDEREIHLTELRQLTFGGENAEAYFSPDGRQLIFQRTPPEGGCDQQYLLDLDSGQTRRLSSGLGRTTCGYFAYPDAERQIYATTEGSSPECPAPPDRSAGYVWPLYDYDLVWQAGPDAAPEPFVPSDAYDAEATVCMQDGRVVFTSTRGGDLDLWLVDPDGSDLMQLTDTPGYDGGAFFTPNCDAIVWRASRPEGEALTDYRHLLEGGLVRPGQLNIFVMTLDGRATSQLTDNGAANFAPYPLPDGSAVLFSSNLGGSPREFDLFVVPMAGGEPERVTFTPEFDGFPMFSPDGQWLVFASNRGATDNQTNLFIARWLP